MTGKDQEMGEDYTLDSPDSAVPQVEAFAARGYARINRHACLEFVPCDPECDDRCYECHRSRADHDARSE